MHVKALSEYKIANISAGQLHSGAVTEEGKVFTWGHNPDTRGLRKLQFYKKSKRPKNDLLPKLCEDLAHLNIKQISCGISHSLVLDEDGIAYAGGSNEEGQLGVPLFTFDPAACEEPFVRMQGIVPTNDPAIKVEAGDAFSVVLTHFGKVYTCGKGHYGRLGQGHTRNLNVLTEIDWFRKNKIQINDVAAGGRHVLAISQARMNQIGQQQD